MYLTIGIAAVALAIAAVVSLALTSKPEATGVARSLAIIQGTVGARDAARAELTPQERILLPLLRHTRWLGGRLSPAGTTERLARMLDRAGNPAFWTVERLIAAKGLAFLCGILVGLYLGRLRPVTIVSVPLLAAAFLHLPDLLVYNAALKRQDGMVRGMAEALDMLTVCVEAGQGFDAALLHVARNVRGPIGGEFARVLSEIQIGHPRGQAFAALGDRAVVPEVKTFVSALTQADRLGLPIAAVLREQTAQMRLIRRQRMEEKAQKVTVKILFPLLLCIFPALFVVIVGPGAIRMVEAFSHLI